MATFRNRKSGVTFEPADPRPFAARPGHYDPVATYPCDHDGCGRTFGTPQGLAAHSRAHEG